MGQQQQNGRTVLIAIFTAALLSNFLPQTWTQHGNSIVILSTMTMICFFALICGIGLFSLIYGIIALRSKQARIWMVLLCWLLTGPVAGMSLLRIFYPCTLWDKQTENIGSDGKLHALISYVPVRKKTYYSVRLKDKNVLYTWWTVERQYGSEYDPLMWLQDIGAQRYRIDWVVGAGTN